jgi:hypothetical protein
VVGEVEICDQLLSLIVNGRLVVVGGGKVLRERRR